MMDPDFFNILPGLQIVRDVSPVYSSCAYVVAQEHTGEALVVDPGNPSVESIIAILGRLGVRSVPFVLLTHEHMDHIAGVEELRNRFGSKILCSAICSESIGDAKQNLSYYADGKGFTCRPADWICERDGWQFEWAGVQVSLVATPGHSPGGICIALGNRALFTGDTLLGNQRTPTHLPGGSAVELKTSLEWILGAYQPETMIFPGHGEAFPLESVEIGKVMARSAKQPVTSDKLADFASGGAIRP